MPSEPSLIMIQFLQWVADRPRSREDVMDAWRSSCPRFPVWEDARADGLIRQCGGERGEHRVELTERGQAALRRAEVRPRSMRGQAAAKAQSAERIVPVETASTRARISGLMEPRAVQSGRKSL
jgi:hypothetical protein